MKNVNIPTILLIFCSSGDKRFSINYLPPIGILSIAAYLESKGIKTEVIDLGIEPKLDLDIASYEIVGFSVNISNRENSLRLMKDIRREYPRKTIIAGGPLCMSNPESILNSSLPDVVFACEGEEALYEFLSTENKESVKGIYVKRGQEYYFTGLRGWIRDLDLLPPPDFRKVNMRKYNNVPKQKRPVSSIMTSRGCPYSCIFCSHAMGRKWRPRSPENVVREIIWQVREFGVREICVYDDNFSLNRQRAEEICDLIIEEKLDVSLQFSNGLRVDNLDADLLEKLKRAGTWLVGLAPEVGNPKIMKKIKKGFDHAQVIKIREECRKLGIKTFGFFMIGFPFENRIDIQDTIRFAKELDCEIVEFNKVIPYSGTELFDLVKTSGYLLNETIDAVRSYHEGLITTHRVGDMSSEEVKSLIQRAYRQYYLRPKKMCDLLRTFSVRDLWELTSYAIRTGNI